MPEKKIVVKDTKAADPGVAFRLETEDNSAFDSKLKVKVKITGQHSTYETVVNIKNTVAEPELDFIVPFGDANWSSEIALMQNLPYEISVEFVTAPSGPYTDTATGQVFPEMGEFEVNVNPSAGPETEPADSKSALYYFINGFRVLFGLAPV